MSSSGGYKSKKYIKKEQYISKVNKFMALGTRTESIEQIQERIKQLAIEAIKELGFNVVIINE